MSIPDFYIPVAFANRVADSLGNVSATTLTVRDREVIGVNVKAIPPFSGASHEATITVTSSKVESSELLRIGNSWTNLVPFAGDNVEKVGVAKITYQDSPDCVRPIDVGCPNPRLPVRLMNQDETQPQSVTGSLFLVKIANYEPEELVNVVVALCYEPESP
jgi:hypothetical protein